MTAWSEVHGSYRLLASLAADAGFGTVTLDRMEVVVAGRAHVMRDFTKRFTSNEDASDVAARIGPRAAREIVLPRDMVQRARRRGSRHIAGREAANVD